MRKNTKNKVIKFKLSDMLELALKQLQADKRSTTKMEYSCDALASAAHKFGKTQGVVVYDYDYDFSGFVNRQWGKFVDDYMGASLHGFSLFDELCNDGYATRKSQYARAIFLTFGIILLKENPEYNNCTFTQPE